MLTIYFWMNFDVVILY